MTDIEIEELNLAQKWKDKDWYETNIPAFVRKYIDTCIPVLEKLFPEKWDLQFNFIWDVTLERNFYGGEFYVKRVNILEKFTFVVKYPETQITNSLGHKLILRDLFVSLLYKVHNSSGKISLRDIKGTRTTYSPEEYLSLYIHSHLPRRQNDTCEFHSFCTGTGGLTNTKQMLRASIQDLDLRLETSIPDKNMLELTLRQISDFIKWESLQGVPHIRMENVVNKKYSDAISQNKVKEAYEQLSNYIDPKKVVGGYHFDPEQNRNRFMAVNYWKHLGMGKLDLDWEIRNGQYSIIDNDKLDNIFFFTEEQFNKKYGNSSEYNFKTSAIISTDYYFYRDNQGNYFSIEESDLITLTHNSYLVFRGEKVPLIIDSNGNKVSIKNRKLYIHPQIKKYVKQQLEFRVKKKTLTSRRARLEDSINS